MKGSASVDESSISGEAAPVEKILKSQAYSGTVVQHGYLELETTSSSTSSTISKIVALVQDAQLNASPTEIMMNKFASYYTPPGRVTCCYGLSSALSITSFWCVRGEH